VHVDCDAGELSLCTSRKCCRSLGANVGSDYIGPDGDPVRHTQYSTHAAHQHFGGMTLIAPVDFAAKGHATAFDFDLNGVLGEVFLPLERR